jgi:transposase
MARPLKTDDEDIKYANELLQTTDDAKTMRMALAVVLPVLTGTSLLETAKLLGISQRGTQNLRTRLNEMRTGRYVARQHGGRQRENMTLEEEKAFLGSWEEQAAQGRIVVASEMREALVEKLGKKLCESYVYRLLKRHGWRKSAPDTRHPKADEAKQEEWKKNSKWKWQVVVRQKTPKEDQRT